MSNFHILPPATPVHTRSDKGNFLDLRKIDQTLARNAAIASKEERPRPRRK